MLKRLLMMIAMRRHGTSTTCMHKPKMFHLHTNKKQLSLCFATRVCTIFAFWQQSTETGSQKVKAPLNYDLQNKRRQCPIVRSRSRPSWGEEGILRGIVGVGLNLS